MKRNTIFLSVLVVLISACVSKKITFYKYEYTHEYRTFAYDIPEDIDVDSINEENINYREEIVINPEIFSIYSNRETLFFVYPADTGYFYLAHTIDSVTNKITATDTIADITPEYAKGPYSYNSKSAIIQDKSVQFKWLNKSDTIMYAGLYGLNSLCKKKYDKCKIFYSERTESYLTKNERYTCDVYIVYCPSYGGIELKARFELIYIDRKSGMFIKKESYRTQYNPNGFQDFSAERFIGREENLINRTYLKRVSKSKLNPKKVKNWRNCP